VARLPSSQLSLDQREQRPDRVGGGLAAQLVDVAATARLGADQAGPAQDAQVVAHEGLAAFADAGTSRFNLGGGLRSRDTVSVRGTLGDDGRWRGRFRLRSVLRRDGDVVDRCRVGPIRWRARPV
jgi:hypothetical protein